MASTPLLGLTLPADGTTNWGALVNTSLTALVDSAVAGTTTLASDADVTLTTTAEAANQARQAVLLCNGVRTAIRTITAPAHSKTYVVINLTTGGFGVKIVGAGPTTGVTIPNGKACLVAWGSSDFVIISAATINLATDVVGTLPIGNGGTGQTTANAAFNALAPSQTSNNGKYLKTDGTNTSWDAIDISTADITGVLPVSNGGTGLSAGTSGGVPYYSASGTLASSAALAANAIVLGGGAGASPATTATGTGVIAALGFNVGSAGAVVTNGGALGTPASGTVTNLTGTASININGTVGATTPNVGTFTRLRTGVGTTASGATITADSDAVNQYNVTALAVPATIAAPSGTPVDGQKLIYRIKDDGTARALTWNATFRPIEVTLPTTTVANKTIYVGCIYNSADIVWDVIASLTQT